MLLDSCATSLSALCEPEDTSCIEAALAAEALAAAPLSGEEYRSNGRVRELGSLPDDDGDGDGDPNR